MVFFCTSSRVPTEWRRNVTETDAVKTQRSDSVQLAGAGDVLFAAAAGCTRASPPVPHFSFSFRYYLASRRGQWVSCCEINSTYKYLDIPDKRGRVFFLQ